MDDDHNENDMDIRALALQLAHRHIDAPSEVIDRAQAYLDFLTGKVTLEVTNAEV